MRRPQPKTSFDGDEVRRHVALLRHPPGTLTEIWTKLHEVGYFDDIKALVAAVESTAGKTSVYVSVNPADPSILQASWAPHNELRRAEHRLSARYVSRITAFLIDIDVHTPQRDPATKITGTDASATPKERDAVLAAARTLIEREGLVCTLINSGNGVQILAPVDLPVGDTASPLDWQARLSLYSHSAHLRANCWSRK